MADSVQTMSHWRPMRAEDLPDIVAISAVVHGDYAEDEATYTERLALYPAGCFTHEQAGNGGQTGAITGFLVSHPWHRETPPALNSALGAIPQDSRSYYLHDLALLPDARGTGAGKAAVALVVDHVRVSGFSEINLIAVNEADSFWTAQGFTHEEASASSPYGPGTYKMCRLVSAD